MKASELIIALQKAIEEHGDLPVSYYLAYEMYRNEIDGVQLANRIGEKDKSPILEVY